MRVHIDLNKSVQENADYYYSLAKKAKKKLAGVAEGEKILAKKLAQEKVFSEKRAVKALAKKRQRKWFEKFHWFYTSENFLVLGGKDAKTNEMLVKKFMDKNDLYFHADVHGAPHVVLKAEGRNPSEASKKEAAVFAAVFSRAWKSKIPLVDVFSVKPEQVSKSAPSGESIGTGSFMVYGEREWFKKVPLAFAIGFAKSGSGFEVFSGPQSAVRQKCSFFVRLSIGSDSKGAAAKKIRGIFSSKAGMEFSIEDILSLLPGDGILVEQ